MKKMYSPKELKEKYPLEKKQEDFIKKSRKIISDIINKKDNRLIVITWPCSIHDEKSAIEYAKKLKETQDNYENLHIIMRVYFEKPRTTVGWKWLINDPNLDWSYDIEKGLEKARKILLEINKIWVATAVEFLDLINLYYFQDLIHWWAIWARTTESQEHRKVVSWLDIPVWFKNSTSWDVQVAIDAIKSSNESHSFLWINENWEVCILETNWNKNWHIILRWWSSWTNYDKKSVESALEKSNSQDIKTWIIIDFSHANSKKDYRKQIKVCENVWEQIQNWNKNIIWVMIESNLFEWSQSHNPDKDKKENLKYWISITDSCISFETNKKMLEELDNSTKIRKNLNN